MNTILEFAINLTGRGSFTLRKTIVLPFALHEGMTVYGYNWDDEQHKKVTKVSLIIKEVPNEPELYVILEPDIRKNAEELDSLVEFYKSCGWKEL